MKLRRRTHPFVEDVAAGLDALRRQWCVCGLPAGNEVHVLPRGVTFEDDAG